MYRDPALAGPHVRKRSLGSRCGHTRGGPMAWRSFTSRCEGCVVSRIGGGAAGPGGRAVRLRAQAQNTHRHCRGLQTAAATHARVAQHTHDMSRSAGPGGRVYNVGGGRSYPSVTTVLNVIDKPGASARCTDRVCSTPLGSPVYVCMTQA